MRCLGPSLSLPLAASVLLACGDGTEPDTMEASIEVTSATANPLGMIDPYTVVLDGEIELAIGPNGRAVFTPVTPGPHEVRLLGTPAHCVVSGSNPRSVTATIGVAHLHFDVACPGTGTLVVTTISPGRQGLPGSYSLLVSGYPSQPIGFNASLTLEKVPSGPVTVTLSAIPGICIALPGNSQTVTIQPGRLNHAEFEVLCIGG